MGVEDYLLASSLIGVLAQRLVRVNCANCKRPERVPAVALRDTEFAGGSEYVEIQRGSGCERCANTGFESRLGIFELLDVDETMRTLIVTNPNANVLRDAALKSGMRTLRDDGWTKVFAGLTTPDEVLRVTQEV
jgi:type II secretory ATPase GspE/PulE/Tfp pilus assembly ATPase PilB-like protein